MDLSFWRLLLVVAAFSGCQGVSKSWQFGAVTRLHDGPVLGPKNDSMFMCPIRGAVAWERKDVFNPTAVVKDGLVYLIYRAEDEVGKHSGTSRLGIATSTDGIHFERRDQPILFPSHDRFERVEWEGGVEDPRVVLSPTGEYILTYTAYDGKTARLMVAVSRDLVHWTKKGGAFSNHAGWSKSGSILTQEQDDGSFLAKKIHGSFWMYWGDTNIYLAKSDDLVIWQVITDHSRNPVPVLKPRSGYFDSDLVEPGPQAILRSEGIVLIYNSRNRAHRDGGSRELPEWSYSAGQALFHRERPGQLIDRGSSYLMTPEMDFEVRGQVNRVVFIEGLVHFNGQQLLYYGTADSLIGVAATRVSGAYQR